MCNFYLIFYVRRMLRITTPLARKTHFHWISKKSIVAREGRQGNFKPYNGTKHVYPRCMNDQNSYYEETVKIIGKYCKSIYLDTFI